MERQRHLERALCLIAGVAVGALTREAWLRLRRKARTPPAVPKESTIRLMTRLALKHGAVNLSQGFPNEPPPREMALAAAGAILDGTSPEAAHAMAAKLRGVCGAAPEKDMLNQYSFPFGAPQTRAALAKYYQTFYPTVPADAEENLTIVLGATEGFAVCLRAICSPGDAVVFFQPFHELYPSQCTLWGLTPRAVTLVERGGAWQFDETALDAALAGARALLFNSPHNPTGKVFGAAELHAIAAACAKHDVTVVTDEIYEHMTFDGAEHVTIASLPGMAARTCIVSAVSKTARATGWRVGWVVSPPRLTPLIRAVHDQLVLQAPTPLQHGVAALLTTERGHFEAIAAEYREKRDVLVTALRCAGFEVGPVPLGAYYLFVGYRSVRVLAALGPVEAAMKLTTEYHVACVPGDNVRRRAPLEAPSPKPR